MKKIIILSGLCLCLVLSGCITEYEATGLEEVGNILVVEGVITDMDTYIRLSRSSNLTGSYSSYYDPYGSSGVDYAQVDVECDDGTRSDARLLGSGHYLIETGKLDLSRKYRLNISIGKDKYQSDYSYPLKTPEIDSIFWRKPNRGRPVNIYVSTQDAEEKIMYYRWSYKEDWEINAEYRSEDYPYRCWNLANSSDLLIGSAEKTVYGIVTDNIININPWDSRLSVLYRIIIKQNAISKRAYDYFANIKKNSQQSGSIFAPVPSELRGNITCITDPSMPVIGYVDVSNTTQNRRYISRWKDNLYEKPFSDCEPILEDSLRKYNNDEIPGGYVKYREDGPGAPVYYIYISCVDCTFYGTEQKSDDWPD